MKKILSVSALLLMTPLMAFAQSNLSSLIGQVKGIMAQLIPLLIGAAVIVFFWGLVSYIRKPEDTKGKQVMMWGLVVLFVMVSVWGIIGFIGNTVGINPGGSITPPTIP